MPKLPKAFARRKSSTFILDDAQNTLPAEPSFRVFDRSARGENTKSFDGGVKLAMASRPSTEPSYRDDNMFEDLTGSRDSAVSNANTSSTTDQSYRLSATSTAPSSTDLHHAHPKDWTGSPYEKPFPDIPIPRVPKSNTFSLKAAGRSFSFGRGKSTPSPTKTLDARDSQESTPTEDNHRQRSVTEGSNASTATPPRLDEHELGMNLGGDFSTMFSGFGKRKSQVMDLMSDRSMSHSPDYFASEPAVPARIYGRSTQPSPLHLDTTSRVEQPQNSWNSRDSNDRLIANASPLGAAHFRDSPPPPVPQHTNPQARPQRSVIAPDSSIRRSTGLATRRKSTTEWEPVDEDAKLLRQSLAASRRLENDSPPPPAKLRDSWMSPNMKKVYDAETAGKGSGGLSRKPVAQSGEENMFDEQITTSAIIAQEYSSRAPSPPPKHDVQKPKVMTPVQFERYKKDQERLKLLGIKPKDEEEEEEDAYDDEEDEAEKRKQVAHQRKKQEAHMSVYRQQMMKMTGDTSSRPSLMPSRSAPNLLNSRSASPDDEEEDDEVPLGILAAHGFPNKSRAPGELNGMRSSLGMRSASQQSFNGTPQPVVGEPTGPGGHLPVFARKLPQDPYVGAGLVNSTNRESLAYGGGSQMGGYRPAQPQPGGLINIIAAEEMNRAARRGSPNPNGEYAPPANGFNGMGTMMPGMPQMGQMTQGDQAQMKMAAQMQQFMEMQMQFMQMMANGGGGSQAQAPTAMPNMARSSTMMNLPPPNFNGGGMLDVRPGSAHQRTMTSLDPIGIHQQSFFAPSIRGPGNGYTPSIAPSERSNIGLPPRYRPVTQAPPEHPSKQRASTMNAAMSMSGALQDWNENKQNAGIGAGPSTIRLVKKSAMGGAVVQGEDEDDEEAWAAMKKKKESKKSAWRSKKQSGNGATTVGYLD